MRSAATAGVVVLAVAALATPVRAQAPAEPPAPARPAPYSVPWQLRPVTLGNVVRVDSALAWFDSAGLSGRTVAITFLASRKLTPKLAPLVRFALVSNHPPSSAARPGALPATALVNPLLGITYATRVHSDYRVSGFLAATVPIGMGGGDDPDRGKAAAASAGIAARSAMDNALFAVNYFTVLGGAGAAYVAHGFTAQAEATVLQLTRVRGPQTQDSSRTNFTTGLHLGYFVVPKLSFGAELRYQRWLSDAAPVRLDPANRGTATFAVGPRLHFKLGKGTWVRPGIAYARGLDRPLTASHYDIVQFDVPVAFGVR